MKVRNVFFLFATLSIANHANAKDIKLGVGLSLPPYILEKENSGMEYEIVEKALAAAGHKFIPVYVPFARVPVALDSGETEGALTINESSNLKVCYSDSHIFYQNFAISLKKKNFNIKSVADLSKHSIAAFQNAKLYLGEEFGKMAGANKEYTEDAQQISQNKKLFIDRVDVVVADKNIFNYFNKEIPNKQEVVFHEIFPKTNYKVGFKDPKVCEEFNAGLKKIHADGTYDAIVKKYTKE